MLRELRGLGFDLWSSCYRVVTTWMGDCLWMGKPSQYVISHACQLSTQPSIPQE